MKKFFQLLKKSYQNWRDNKPGRLGAAIAYYAIFSLAPLLLIGIALASLFYGQVAAQGQLVNQISGMVGPTAAASIQEMLVHTSGLHLGRISAIIGVILILLGAMGVVSEIQASLDTIWQVPAKPSRGIIGYLKTKLILSLFVIGSGVLLVISLLASTFISAFSTYVGTTPIGNLFILQCLNFAISFGVTTFLFALILKILPNIKLSWPDVILGGALTSFLFTLGKTVLAFYLAHSSLASSYGAAGSLAVLLVWIYYSAQIFLFGAQFTREYSITYGCLKKEKEISWSDRFKRLTKNIDQAKIDWQKLSQ